jgi:hypothetical protein
VVLYHKLPAFSPFFSVFLPFYPFSPFISVNNLISQAIMIQISDFASQAFVYCLLCALSGGFVIYISRVFSVVCVCVFVFFPFFPFSPFAGNALIPQGSMTQISDDTTQACFDCFPL